MNKIISIILLAALPWGAQAFELQGHRGARGLAPENTIAGFIKALEVGVHTLELDIVMSKDLTPHIGHDPVLGGHIVRQNGQWIADPGPRVFDLTREEIARYDVGRINPNHRYARQFPDQRAQDGVAMPTLFALSELFFKEPSLKSVALNIETKINPLRPDDGPTPEAFMTVLMEILTKSDLRAKAKDITIQSFDWCTLRRAQMYQGITTACLTAEQSWLDNVQAGRPGPSPWTAGFDVDDYNGSVPRLVQAVGCKIWSPHFRDVTPARLAEAKALGLRTIVWTVNEPGDIRAMMDLGVDGIISDYPDRVREDMARRNMPLPPSLRVTP